MSAMLLTTTMAGNNCWQFSKALFIFILDTLEVYPKNNHF